LERGVEHPPHLTTRLKKECSFFPITIITATITMYGLTVLVNGSKQSEVIHEEIKSRSHQY